LVVNDRLTSTGWAVGLEKVSWHVSRRPPPGVSKSLFGRPTLAEPDWRVGVEGLWMTHIFHWRAGGAPAVIAANW